MVSLATQHSGECYYLLLFLDTDPNIATSLSVLSPNNKDFKRCFPAGCGAFQMETPTPLPATTSAPERAEAQCERAVGIGH